MKINLSKFKGIAFDLDDTLIDRKKAFDKLCIKLSEDFDCFNHFSKKEALKYFWGLNSFNDFNIKSSLQQINKDFHNFGLSYQEFYDYYYKNMSEIVEAYEGASHLLDKLIEKKINFGIVTNGSHYQYQKIKNTGLENKYNFVIASEIFGHSKPKKEIFLETLRLLNLTVKEVENVVFIGDNPYTDIIGAQSIGMKTIWISMGRKYPEDLDPPNYIIENIKELDI